MTDWETTKIKGEVKAAASDIEPTYTDIMRMGITAYDEGLITPEGVTPLDGEVVETQQDVDEQAIAEAVVDDLGAIAGGPQVDDSQIAAAVVQQFDYAELAQRVADEIEGRMR